MNRAFRFALGWVRFSSLRAEADPRRPPVRSQSKARRSVGDVGFATIAMRLSASFYDREAAETAGPGAVQPNLRRVYQMVGAGEHAR